MYHVSEDVVAHEVGVDSHFGFSVVLLDQVHLGFPDGTTVSLGFGIVGLVVASLRFIINNLYSLCAAF